MPRRVLRSLAAAATVAGCTVAGCTATMVGAAAADPGASGPGAAGPGLAARVIVAGSTLHHPVGASTETLTDPDDVKRLGDDVFVAFQNGVGSTGTPSPSGNTASTLVEMTRDGAIVNQWDMVGKIDGLGADRSAGRIIATVNEDGNSSLYVVDPSAPASSGVTRYAYDVSPLPHGGGTDDVTVADGTILVSASAPTVADGPAMYAVTLQDPAPPGGTGVAHVRGVFSDTASATPLDPGAPSKLALTDPDSNMVVPRSVPGLGGDVQLDSQADQQEIFVRHPASASPQLSVLAISRSVDDTAYARSSAGELVATDPTHDTVDVVSGLQPGQAYVAITPCGAASAPATCPAPGYPANSLGTLDLHSGTVTPVTLAGADLEPSGMLYVGHGHGHDHGDGPGQGNDQGDQGGAGA